MSTRVFRYNCLAVFLGIIAAGSQPAEAFAEKPNSAVRPRITISKATTFFTKPVGKDGYVNYVAALNRHYGKGVTPENNAVVLLIRAFGPMEIPKKLRPKFFKKLGIKPLPEKGAYSYYPDVGKGLKGAAKVEAQNRWDDQYDKASDGPWKRSQCPDIAKWLNTNEEILQLITEASLRPKLYLPFVAEGKEQQLLRTLSTRFGTYQSARSSIRMLSMRANLHLGESRIKQAADDLMAGHRLARLMDQEGLMSGSLVAHALEAVSSAGVWRVAHSGQLTSAQAVDFRKRLDRLKPLGRFAANYNVVERCYALEFFAVFARDGLKDAREWEDAGILPKGAAKKLTGKFDEYFDADIVLKEMNRHVNGIVKVASIQDPGRRRKAIRKLQQAIQQFERDAKRLPKSSKEGKLKKADRAKLSRWFSRALMAFSLPNVTIVLDAQDRANTYYDLSRIVLSLAAYRADHGKYPTNLAALSPKYINTIPSDRFTGKPLKYKLTKTGYLLYSVGVNGQDDGGQRRDSKQDDIAVRTPKS